MSGSKGLSSLDRPDGVTLGSNVVQVQIMLKHLVVSHVRFKTNQPCPWERSTSDNGKQGDFGAAINDLFRLKFWKIVSVLGKFAPNEIVPLVGFRSQNSSN